jgi:hypothetical protein
MELQVGAGIILCELLMINRRLNSWKRAMEPSAEAEQSVKTGSTHAEALDSPSKCHDSGDHSNGELGDGADLTPAGNERRLQ